VLGWLICIYQQQNDGSVPASFGAAQGRRLAVWQTELEGIRWIDELVQHELAISLGGDGYPLDFTATAAILKTPILSGPPCARKSWVTEEGDVLLPGWLGKTTIDRKAWDECRPDEWLIVRVWDES